MQFEMLQAKTEAEALAKVARAEVQLPYLLRLG